MRACSDGLDAAGDRSGSWAERQIPYIESLPHKSRAAALLAAAVKTHNARCIVNDEEPRLPISHHLEIHPEANPMTEPTTRNSALMITGLRFLF